MPVSNPAVFPQPPVAHPARVAIFSFPLTWSFLADFPDPKELERPQSARGLILSPIVPIQSVEQASHNPELRREGPDRWEMVIPKMVRPPQSNAGVARLREPAPQKAADLPRPSGLVSSPLFQSAGNSGSFSNSRPALVSLFVLLAGGLLWFNVHQSSVSSGETFKVGAALPVDSAGWMPLTKAPRVSVLRGSMNLTDFQLEFRGQIDTKALGWVFRARDPQNFYVSELRIVKPGRVPVVSLKRFAVIEGRDQPANEVLLPMPVRLDTIYKVRVDAVGEQFTTWIQDQKLDQWVDSRLAKGGVGWYSESGLRQEAPGTLSVFTLIRN
jgi:hypothetical protein